MICCSFGTFFFFFFFYLLVCTDKTELSNSLQKIYTPNKIKARRSLHSCSASDGRERNVKLVGAPTRPVLIRTNGAFNSPEQQQQQQQ